MKRGLSIVFALILLIFPRTAENSTPEAFVLMGLNVPRYSAGASGFKSNESMCEGPPAKLIKMAEVAVVDFGHDHRFAPLRQYPAQQQVGGM